MNVYRAGLIFVLSAGVGTITLSPVQTRAQDRGAQDQHQQSGQKAPAKQGRSAARPAQTHTAAHSQQSHAGHPQQSHAGHPQQSHAARPQETQASHPTTHAARPQQGNEGRPQQNRNNTRPASQGNRQPNRGPQGRPNYQFRSQDRGRLRQYYQGGFGRIDRRHRPRFSMGGYIPRTYWGDFQPVPYSLIGYLPAVPPGYAIGYYDGYVVVYDPTTYLIVSVLDILQ